MTINDVDVVESTAVTAEGSVTLTNTVNAGNFNLTVNGPFIWSGGTITVFGREVNLFITDLNVGALVLISPMF